MCAIVRVLVSIVWALWFGGLVTLFIGVTTLFRNDRELAVQAAPQLFHVFEKYQLILAAIALLATFAWRLMVASKSVVWVFALLGVATLGAVFQTTMITPRIDALHAAGQTQTPEFKQKHGISMIVYTGEVGVLLAAGIVLVISLSKHTDGARRVASPGTIWERAE